MPITRKTRLVALVLAAALILACQIGPQPTATPTPVQRAQDVPAETPTQTVVPTAAETAAQTPTLPPPSPAAPTPTATATQTPTPQPAAPALPPLPDAGPLPAPWHEIDLGDPPGDGPNPLYPTDLAIDVRRGVAYVLSTCSRESLHEIESQQACVTAFDLTADRVLRTTAMDGESYGGRLVLGGQSLYLHHPWSGALYVLDRETLAVGARFEEVYGITSAPGDGQARTYAVTRAGLLTFGSGDEPIPIERSYDDAPAAMAADDEQLYVVGYSSLQVYDRDLQLVASIPLEEGQLRSIALDADRGRLYVGYYDGLYVLDTTDNTFSKVPDVSKSILRIALDPDRDRLYAFVYIPGWFGGTEVVAIDTETWETTSLYQTLSGELSALAVDGARERLLVLSRTDHALIPIDTRRGAIGPRLAIGLEVSEVAVDATTDLLWVSDSAGRIHVLDRRTYAPVARLYGGREMSLDATHTRTYAGDARVPEVTVYDSQALSVERTIPQAGMPRANAANGEVVIVNRRFYVYDGASGEARAPLAPEVGEPPADFTGGYYTIATDVVIDALRGLTATTTYTPWPGKPGAQESIDYDPASGRAYYALITGGYVAYSSIAVHPDLGQLQARAQPVLSLEGLSGAIRLDPPAQRLYVVRGQYVFVLDSETLNRIGRIDAGDWTPEIAALDEELGRLYTPRGRKLVVWTRTGGAMPAPLPHEPMVVTKTVSAILPSPNYIRDRTVLATIDGKLCRSTDGGETWLWLRGGLPELGEYMTTVYAAFSPDYAQDETIFYGAHLGDTHGEGVYRSTDGGETWQMTSDGLHDLRVYRLALSPNYARDGTVLAYARTQQGQALYRSTDRGRHWAPVVRQVEYGRPPLPEPEQVFYVAEIDPRFQCDYQGKCERSADGGKTWEPLDTAQFTMKHVVDYALSPHYAWDDTVYLLTENGVFRYNDRTGVGEIVAGGPLYGPRDYTNSFTSIATAAVSDREHAIFVGAHGGGLWRFVARTLPWIQIWPLTETPTPLPPTPSPTPCAQAVDARFAVADRTLAGLGCATGPADEMGAAFQPFERGSMIWLRDPLQIHVLRQDGVWLAYADTWQEGEPDRDPGLVPPKETLRQPVRGFGKVWREQLGGAAAWIGWASEEEQGFTALVQPFAGGTLVRGAEGQVYALYDGGTWESVR